MTEKDEKLAIEDLDEAAGGNSDYDNEEWLIQNNKKNRHSGILLSTM